MLNPQVPIASTFVRNVNSHRTRWPSAHLYLATGNGVVAESSSVFAKRLMPVSEVLLPAVVSISLLFVEVVVNVNLLCVW